MLRKLKQDNPNLFRVQAMRAPIKRINSEFRFQVVAWLKVESERELLPEVYKIADKFNNKNTVSFVEINPTSMR